tara:strand:+ start:245 stop:400 length:156 start_codon:yes stop_codon:yes gene_type:complete
MKNKLIALQLFVICGFLSSLFIACGEKEQDTAVIEELEVEASDEESEEGGE